VSGESHVLSEAAAPRRNLFAHKNPALRQGLLKLLAIKDSDIRLLTLEQCRDAVDKGLHAGGAFSATIPLVALYYGGFLRFDVADPTRPGQDLFTLSKGHAVAALASIYAELGYFDRQVLKNSRSHKSILNGHPGPLLPGIHLATGPMKQGFGVAWICNATVRHIRDSIPVWSATENFRKADLGSGHIPRRARLDNFAYSSTATMGN
jgi:hypothetical protein